MNRHHSRLLTAAVLFAALACKQEPNPYDYDRFLIEQTRINVDAEGGTASIVVNTNKDWTLVPEGNYDWITYSKMSGRGTDDILLTFARNEVEERRATLSVSADGYDPIAILVVQEPPKSELRLAQPYIDKNPVMGVDGSLEVNVPYFNALGTESVRFTLSFTGDGALGLTPQHYTCESFQRGEGVVTIPVQGTPGALGPVNVTVEVDGDTFQPVTVRVIERIAYDKYINWNHWSIGWTRKDFNLLRGSYYDDSWTSEAVHPTASGVGTDHRVWASSTTLPDCEGAYLSLVCAEPIYAAGQASGPTGTPTGLTGYQFNPGYQVQGMMKDDYVFVYIPKVSIAAGGTITLESSVGGATAASNVYIVEYSTDNEHWTAFGDTKTIEVGTDTFEYHYRYIAANSAMRYVYARDSMTDPAYDVIHATVPAAVNGPLYVRFRSLGINGSGAIQTGKGWSDFKFIDISF